MHTHTGGGDRHQGANTEVAVINARVTNLSQQPEETHAPVLRSSQQVTRTARGGLRTQKTLGEEAGWAQCRGVALSPTSQTARVTPMSTADGVSRSLSLPDNKLGTGSLEATVPPRGQGPAQEAV